MAPPLAEKIDMVVMPASDTWQTGHGEPAAVMVVEEVDTPVGGLDQSLVTVRYGSFTRRLAAGDWTVAQAKQWARLAWGVGYFVDACLDGWLVPLTTVPRACSELVFLPLPGFKGAEDGSGEIEAVFARHPELMTIAEEVVSQQLDSRRSVELALVMAVSFFVERCGQAEQGDMFLIRRVLKMLAELVERFAAGREPSAPKDVIGQHAAIPSTPGTVGQPSPASEDMTTLAAARELGCSRSMIYKLCDRGELAYRRVGNRYRVPRASVEEYKQKTANRAEPPAPPSAGYQFKHL